MKKTSEALRNFYKKYIRKPRRRAGSATVEQLRETSERLRSAYDRFETELNEDMMESIIYEIKSLKALYRFLILRAKEEGAECPEISVFERSIMR